MTCGPELTQKEIEQMAGKLTDKERAERFKMALQAIQATTQTATSTEQNNIVRIALSCDDQ